LDAIEVVSNAGYDDGSSQNNLELMPRYALSELSDRREDTLLTEDIVSS
jgi:hypothetical protein